jgi:hypothetical protein
MIRHFRWIFLGVVLAMQVATPDAHAQKRVALVVGNSAYQHSGLLANPSNDASDVAAALKRHGFQVIEGFDLSKASFDLTLRDFANALEGAAVGLFFYAGHGLQVNGLNYLVPVDAELRTKASLDFETVRLDTVQRLMEQQTETNVLFLDACRDNPLTRNLARAMGTRSSAIGAGLAPVEGGVGTLISFSTQPGNVALDGTGRNSPYASALVRQLQGEAAELTTLLIEVRNEVLKETQRKQVPWEHSALTGKFYFRPQGPAAGAPGATGEHAFDGVWISNFRSETCATKSGSASIVIERSEVVRLGAVVGRNGEVNFVAPGTADRNVKVHHRIRLDGDTGTGVYTVPGTNCVGTTALKRVGSKQPAQ